MAEFYTDHNGKVIKNPKEGTVGYDRNDVRHYFSNGRWVPENVIYAIV